MLKAIIAFLLSNANAFQIPQIKLPWDNTKNPSGSNTKALQPGDTIAVIGASGNVGKLVALRLSDTYKVKGIVRDASSVQRFFKERSDAITLYEVDLLNELEQINYNPSSLKECPESLKTALNANAIVICTGTTAFPTKAWSRNEEKEVTSDVLEALLQSKFRIKDAVSKLDEKGLNTPYNVDALANQLILCAWNKASTVKKRAILLSSIGVQRRDTMPFPILNTCGVLSAKAIAEETLKEEALLHNYNYSILRPGQLFGGPYDNNYYLGTLFQLDKDAQTQDVSVARGDVLLGDTLRSTLAEVTAQICEIDKGLNMDFAVVNVKGDVPDLKRIQGLLAALQD